MKKTKGQKAILIGIYTIIYFAAIFLFQTGIIDIEWGFYDGFKDHVCVCATILYLIFTVITLFVTIDNELIPTEETTLINLGFKKIEEPNIYGKDSLDGSVSYSLLFMERFAKTEKNLTINTDNQQISVVVFYKDVNIELINESIDILSCEYTFLKFKSMEVGNNIAVEIKYDTREMNSVAYYDRTIDIINICDAADRIANLISEKE